MLQAAGRVMRDTGGSAIVNITSRLATIGVPTMGIYSASKGALKALTTAAAVELAPCNIRVNAVAPGMTRTPLYQAWLAAQEDPGAAAREVVAGIPLGRLAAARLGCSPRLRSVAAYAAVSLIGDLADLHRRQRQLVHWYA